MTQGDGAERCATTFQILTLEPHGLPQAKAEHTAPAATRRRFPAPRRANFTQLSLLFDCNTISAL